MRSAHDVSKATDGLENELSRRWSDGKLGEWAELVLQAFRRFTHVTAHSPNLLSLLLRHRIFTYITWRAAHGWLRLLRRHIKSKRPGMLSDGIDLLHDNARSHTANLVRDKLQKFDWETLLNPPYRPDLSPWDLYIFDDLNKDIQGRRFHSREEVQEWVKLRIHQRPTFFLLLALLLNKTNSIVIL